MQTDIFTGRPTCIQGGRLPSDEERRALQHDHGRRLEALARLGAAASRVGIGTDPDDDIVLWDADEVGLLAGADPLWRELNEAACAFRELLPIISLEDFGFPAQVEDLLAECGLRLRPVSSGVEETAFEGEEVALLADAADGSYRAMLEKFNLIMRLGGMPTEVIGVTKNEGVLVTKQTLGERLAEGADTSDVQPAPLIPIPSRFLRVHRDHPRLYFVDGKPWLVADLHSKNLVRAADGELRAIDLLAAPFPAELIAKEPLLAEWLERAWLDPSAPLLRAAHDDEL